MKILCLLATNWHPRPDSFHQLLTTQPDRRHLTIARQLFYTPNLTGSRLLTVFGELMKAHDWVFEQVSTTPPSIGDSGGRPAYNVQHVRGLIDRHRPDVILAVGIAPREAVNDMRMAKKAGAPLPPVVECLQPSVNRPGWLVKMTASRDRLEEVLTGEGVAA